MLPNNRFVLLQYYDTAIYQYQQGHLSPVLNGLRREKEAPGVGHRLLTVSEVK